MYARLTGGRRTGPNMALDCSVRATEPNGHGWWVSHNAPDHSAPTGTLLQVIPECTGVHNVPCNSSDDFNLKLYSEFVKVSTHASSILLCSAFCHVGVRAATIFLPDGAVVTQIAYGKVARAPGRRRAPVQPYSRRSRVSKGMGSYQCAAVRLQAAAESHVLEHACRVLLRLSEGAATAAQTPAEREEHFPAFLALSRMALNKVRCSWLLRPLACDWVGSLRSSCFPWARVRKIDA